MRTIFFFLILNSIGWDTVKAQSDTAIWRLNAQDEAGRLDSAFNAKDWVRYAKLNHPKLVEAMGGAAAFVTTMNDQMKEIEAQVTIDTLYFGVPYNFIVCDSSINCLLPQTMLIRMNDSMHLRSRVYLVGSSEDKGRTWYFVDGSNGAAFLDVVIPNRCKILVIPEKQQALIRRKEGG